MKWISLFACALLNTFAIAQTFDWLSTGRNLNIEVKYASMDQHRNMLVAAEFQAPTYIDGKIELLTTAKTKAGASLQSSKPAYHTATTTFLNYDSIGRISWSIDWNQKYYKLLGVDHTVKNEPLVLVYVDGYIEPDYVRQERAEYSEEEDDEKSIKKSDEGEPYYGDLSFLNPEGLDPFVASGLYVLKLNEEGNLIEIIPLLTETQFQIDVVGFQVTPQQTFAIHGTFEDDLELPLKNLPAKGGGDILIVFSREGKLLWGDALSYDKQMCCSFYTEAQSMSVAPDGSIYLTGAFNHGITLSSGKKLKVAQLPSPEMKEPYESYLIAYTPEGRVRWTKQSGSQVMIHKIAASNDAVYLSYKWHPTSTKAFGISADTTSKKHLVIAALNTSSGIEKWHTTHGAERVQEMVCVNNALYIAGALSYNRNSGIVGDYTLMKLENAYIAAYTNQGKLLRVKPIRPDFDSRPEHVYIFPVSLSEIYMAYSGFVSIKMPLKVFDELFMDITNQGYFGVIGKITF